MDMSLQQKFQTDFVARVGVITQKGELMSDFKKLINAIDLIEWIIETCPDWCEGAIRSIVDHIDEMPSAKPETRWIPCSERMPEEHEWLGTKKFGTTISDEVYVTFENDKGERFCKHMQFQNGELSSYDQLHMDTWYKGSKPIAWMPLPEPWRGEGNEHND